MKVQLSLLMKYRLWRYESGTPCRRIDLFCMVGGGIVGAWTYPPFEKNT